MLKNITMSAEEALIHRARKRAAERRTTLNVEFRQWLAQYGGQAEAGSTYQALSERLAYSRPGRRFTRDERNAR